MNGTQFEMLTKRQASCLANALNSAVHRVNVYCNGRRLINAETVRAVSTEDTAAHWYVTLEDLHGGQKTPLHVLTMNGAKLMDGYGREITI